MFIANNAAQQVSLVVPLVPWIFDPASIHMSLRQSSLPHEQTRLMCRHPDSADTSLVSSWSRWFLVSAVVTFARFFVFCYVDYLSVLEPRNSLAMWKQVSRDASKEDGRFSTLLLQVPFPVSCCCWPAIEQLLSVEFPYKCYECYFERGAC